MRVLIADDHEVAREGLKVFVRCLGDGIEILEAATLYEALELIQAECGERPLDLALLDLLMPGMDGLVGLRRLRAACPMTPVVIVSGLYDPDLIDDAYAIGARGFVPKGMTGVRLTEALACVLDGATFRPPHLSDPAEHCARDDALDPDRHPVARLTPREQDVLGLLVHGLSNKEIARRLQLQEVTVKAHLSGVFRKLEAGNRTQAVRIALDLGWRRQPDGALT